MVARNEICGTPHPHPHTPITHITAASHSNRDVATDPGNTISAAQFAVYCLQLDFRFTYKQVLAIAVETIAIS